MLFWLLSGCAYLIISDEQICDHLAKFDDAPEDCRLGDVSDRSRALGLYNRFMGYSEGSVHYSSWHQHPPWEGSQPTNDPFHGDTAEIWMDTAASASLGDEITDEGILLLVGYEGEYVREWFVMQKLAGYDEDNRDWFWASYIDGEPQVVGREEGCISCHEVGDDSVMSASTAPNIPDSE